jgi:hypothetical protein
MEFCSLFSYLCLNSPTKRFFIFSAYFLDTLDALSGEGIAYFLSLGTLGGERCFFDFFSGVKSLWTLLLPTNYFLDFFSSTSFLADRFSSFFTSCFLGIEIGFSAFLTDTLWGLVLLVYCLIGLATFLTITTPLTFLFCIWVVLAAYLRRVGSNSSLRLPRPLFSLVWSVFKLFSSSLRSSFWYPLRGLMVEPILDDLPDSFTFLATGSAS